MSPCCHRGRLECRLLPRTDMQKVTLMLNIPSIRWGLVAASLLAAGTAFAQDVTGAGATFPAPVYAKWADAYNKATGAKVNYQSVGSGAGIRQIQAKTVDFGASDMPLKDDDLSKNGLLQFPTVIGGVVPVVNVKGIQPGQIKLTGHVLGDIYLGKITKWNDPAIAALNAGAAHHGDRRIRQRDASVQGSDGRIVPLGDLAEIDVAEHVTSELDLAGLDALDVDHRHHAADHGGELQQAVLAQVIVLQRHVGSTEVDRLGLDLADAGARADRLVVDLGTGRLVVGVGPLGVDRRRERGTGTGDVLRECAAGGQQGSGNQAPADRGDVQHERDLLHVCSRRQAAL